MRTRLIWICAAGCLGGLALCAAAGEPASAADPVATFIRANWATTIRSHAEDDGTLIGLPKPYTVPCASDMFQEMYYWDTYFTNVGLMLSDRMEQARNNCENMAYLIGRYGFMPNGNRTYYLSRSQPPFFTRMAAEVFVRTKDAAWLAKMYAAAVREHAFWTERRMTPCGLNRYGSTFANRELMMDFSREYCGRLGIPLPKEDARLALCASNFLSYCESGWDCNSRFGLHGAIRFADVDLNALLYGMETDLADFAKALGNGEEPRWRATAATRRARMNELMWDEERGMFCDYDFVRGRRSDFVSAAAFYPLFTGLATPEQARRALDLLPRLEREYGLACSENRNLLNLQWDYPHSWACLQYLAVRGLERYGHRREAARLAEKYVRTVRKVFAETGALWEKYDTEKGAVSVTKEYESPKMLGWSAGVYLYCLGILESAR